MFNLRHVIICLLLMGFISVKSTPKPDLEEVSSHDFIEDLRTAFPELLQADLEELFGQYSQTFAKLQIFAQSLAKHSQYVISSKNLQTFLSAKDLKTFSRYIASPEFEKKLEKMQEKNPILVALAKKWIRNAALRVFADPNRSFLEVIVNACDATAGPRKAVGKFGMGFFSILSFLSYQETDGTVIKIRTISKSDFGEEGFFAYSMEFQKTGPDLNVWDDISIKFSQLKDEELKQLARELDPSLKSSAKLPTGTIISITLLNSQKMFSTSTLNSLKGYVGYMVNYRWVPIFLNNDTEPINKNALSPEALIDFPVNVFVLPNELKVVDRGFGISLPVALSSLLIPSSSTKTKTKSKYQDLETKNILVPDFVSLPYKKDVTQSHFIITVNGTVVVDKIIADPIKNEIGKVIDFNIEMPQSTQLTLARDEILISEDGNSFEEAYLKNVINKTISDVMTRKLSSTHLNALYKGLLAWETQSAARYIKSRFTGFLKKELQNKLQKNEFALAIPSDYFDQLKNIFEYFAQAKSVSYTLFPINGDLVNYDFGKFENALVSFAAKRVYPTDEETVSLIRNAINYQLIRGMRVFFVPENILNKISTLGMQTLLFVPEPELLDKSNISENIVAKCTELDLSAYGRKESVNTALLISTFSNILNFSPKKSASQNILRIFNKISAFNFLNNHKFLLRKEEGQFHGVLANEFILNLFGISAQSIPNEDDQYLNFTLTAMLSDFGINTQNASQGQLYYSNSLGQFQQLWPLLEESTENLAKLILMLIWFKVNNTDANFSDEIDFRINAKDYFFKLCFREISLRIGFSKTYLEHEVTLGPTWTFNTEDSVKRVIQPFESLGFGIQYIDAINFKLVNPTTPVFIGRKGVTQNALLTEVQALLKFISPATNYDQTFKFACENFNMVNAFTQMFLIKNASQRIIQNRNQQVQINGLIDALSGFYLQYCNIPENEFKKVYGSSTKIKVINPAPQVDTSMIVGMLDVLSSRPKSFNRILQLQIDDFANQTDLTLRSAELVQNILYFPLITANTVFSTLAKFFYSLSGQHEDRKLAILCSIIDLAQSAQDLNFVLHVLMAANNFELIQMSLNKQNNIQFQNFLAQIKDLVQRYIHEKIDEFTILDFYQKCRNESFNSLDYRLNSILQMPITKIVYEYLGYALSEQKDFERKGYQQEFQALTKNVRPFPLTKLMRAHFTGQGILAELQKNNLKAVLKKIYAVKIPVDSWKITQAVEAGSQRDAAEAASIECLQNSVDAIKGFFKKLKDGTDQKITDNFELRTNKIDDLCSLKFDLSLIQSGGTNNAQVLLTIQDFVGMPSLETLLADLVLPDYSKKTPAQGNIGDMGNGTFKIYQAAQSVVITTRLINDPSKIFTLVVTPHRNSDGLVDDLELACIQKNVDKNWQNFWGTKFEVLFREKNRSDALVNLMAAKDFLATCAGTTNVLLDEQQKRINVYFKNELLNNFSESNLLYQHKVDDKILFKVYKRENIFLQSYFTTAGVPFQPLSPVCHEMALLPKNFISLINSGLIINFEPGTYQPVQSRTRLNLSKQILKSLKECLIEVVYIFTLDQHKNNPLFLNSIFTHFGSKFSDFEQLMLDGSEQNILSDYMNAFLAEKGVNDALNQRTFFCFYKSLTAIKNAVQQQKSFFDFIDNEFKTGLVKQIKNIVSSLQSSIDQAFDDKTLDNQTYSKFCENQRAALKNDVNKLFRSWKNHMTGAKYAPKALIDAVVIPWFESKIDGITLTIKDREKAAQTAKTIEQNKYKFTDPALKSISPLLNVILAAYGNVYFRLANLTKKVPNISFKQCPPGENGYFMPKINKLVISPAREMLTTNLLKMLQSLLNGQYEDVKNNPAYEALFGIRRGAKCGTVVHELRHAGTQTDDSYHEADFENLAKQQVAEIISDLFPEWCNEITHLLNRDKTAILKQISQALPKIEPLEKANQEAMIQVLWVED